MARSCPQTSPGWGPGAGLRWWHRCISSFLPTQLRYHFCPSSPPAPHPQRGPALSPWQSHGGSLRTSQELMLQMMLLICQLLNLAQAPTEVCLSSGNGTNMVLFLPRAKPYCSCIALGCFLRLLLAQSRAWLVQRHVARAGLALLAPINVLSSLLSPLTKDSLGHPPAQPLVLVAATGDGCPALKVLVLWDTGSPPCRGDAPGKPVGQQGQSGAQAWFSLVGGAGCPLHRGLRHR